METVTPTGASIVKALTRQKSAIPSMVVESVGHGAGRADTPDPNVVALLIGEETDSDPTYDAVTLIETNVDDVSPETLGFVMDELFKAGALDVWFTPVTMKKNRPGIVLSALSEPDRAGMVADFIFRETGTFGLRISERRRRLLDRRVEQVTTPYGDVTVKIGMLDGEIVQVSPEYESCAGLARAKGVPLREVYTAAVTEFKKTL